MNARDHQERNDVLLGENGDILARYRIPREDNHVDYTLQLPDDSDSSNFSSDHEEEEAQQPPSENNTAMPAADLMTTEERKVE